MTSQDHVLSKEQSQGQLPLSWEASGLDRHMQVSQQYCTSLSFGPLEFKVGRALVCPWQGYCRAQEMSRRGKGLLVSLCGL